MGTVGDDYDSAMAENLFVSLEKELFKQRQFKSVAFVRLAESTPWQPEVEQHSVPEGSHAALSLIRPDGFG